MTDYDALLFDSDGILVEPPAHETKAEAVRAAFAEVGVAQPDPDHVGHIVTGAQRDRLREICATYDVGVEAFWDARERLDEESQFAQFEAGARTTYDDVSVVADLPQPRGVVSNNHHSTIAFVLDFFDLQGLFDTYYGREMTVESLGLKKPNTHYLDRALADLGADDALYVGDSASDVRAAHRGGMDSVFVRRPHCRDAALPVAPTYDVASLEAVAEIVGE